MKFDVHYNTDCFDFLPLLVEKIKDGELEKFDIGITDPPYDVKFGRRVSPIKKKTIKNYAEFKEGKKKYIDDIPNYKDFSMKWLDLMLQCCVGVIFTCGTKHHYDWIEWNRPPYHEKYWYKTNACSFIKLEPLLFYGKVTNFSRLRQVVDIPINIKREIKTEHPSPKPLRLYDYMVKKLNPSSVLDCFFGSGTVGHACIINNINFTGIDIGDYSNDWKKRKENCDYQRRLI